MREDSCRFAWRTLLLALFLAVIARPAWACEDALTPCEDTGFVLATRAAPTRVLVDAQAPSPVRHAAAAFARDTGRVTGTDGTVIEEAGAARGPLVIVGTLDSPAITALIARGALDVSSVRGRWEGYLQTVVDDPVPGIDSALVIAGNDPRGVVFGLYDLSERIGVSPWHWWADVPVTRRETVRLAPGTRSDAPAVRYRGFFINDEDPAFGNWAREQFGGINAAAYERVFDLLLRLKGNYLWPAMWGKSLAEDDPATLSLAADMGVVLGTSHHEPLTRAHVEWERAKEAGEASGEWNYATNAATLQDFWRAGMERFVDSGAPGVVTIGMRGDGDEAMSEDTAIPLLEQVVADQRAIIAQTTGRPAAETPQVWALYKEVQDYYDQGMQVPADVTLLFSDDNWGQIRRLPDPAAAPREGGYGVYYHFDYVGGPRSYKWIDTIQNGKTWQQMDLAWQRGARELWIVNVGDIKPAELPLDFFLEMAWNPPAMTLDRLADYDREWARQQFGSEHADEIGEILGEYARLVSRRKPELLGAEVLRDPESRQIAAAFATLRDRVIALRPRIAEAARPAFYELVEHRVLAVANLYQMYLAAADGDDEAIGWAMLNDEAATNRYHRLLDGKWNHMMSQTHIGYTDWDDPDTNIRPVALQPDVAERATAAGSLVTPAASIVGSSKNEDLAWHAIPHLGSHGTALAVLPQGRPATTPADAIFAEYSLDVPRAGEWTLAVNLAPTLDTLGDDGLRLGLQIDDGPVIERRFLLEPNNGVTDTPARAAWAEAVTANEVTLAQPLGHRPAGPVRVRIYRIDDNVVLDELVLRPAE
ncbi:glycosyl hydrolase 115 family protein [Aurantiacibacter spongiae]|uniref:Gylcosyl hydrolase 115 C-terminal domain-containing protein n=1 Tax=Aurantiacibacter spongiae TaxID=2488860 RepID=A0A3N5CVS8_9SPHN|nr:glycosyl hydrolase 115 family protein [Aurantiacibacter spongiae]RPF70749.1 hypothetical protein EG799_03270 [Aurantiacibacter spongiae]